MSGPGQQGQQEETKNDDGNKPPSRFFNSSGKGGNINKPLNIEGKDKSDWLSKTELETALNMLDKALAEKYAEQKNFIFVCAGGYFRVMEGISTVTADVDVWTPVEADIEEVQQVAESQGFRALVAQCQEFKAKVALLQARQTALENQNNKNDAQIAKLAQLKRDFPFPIEWFNGPLNTIMESWNSEKLFNDCTGLSGTSPKPLFNGSKLQIYPLPTEWQVLVKLTRLNGKLKDGKYFSDFQDVLGLIKCLRKEGKHLDISKAGEWLAEYRKEEQGSPEYDAELLKELDQSLTQDA